MGSRSLTEFGWSSYNIQMHIAILSRNRSLYSTRRLVQAAQSRGHKASVIDTLSIAVEVGQGHGEPGEIRMIGTSPLGLAKTISIPKVDAIVPRIGTSVTFYGLAVVRQFESLGVVTTATADAIARSRDKLHSLQTMHRAGLPIPRTAVIATPKALVSAVQTVGGLPVVIKLIRGTQGRGVVLARNLATAAAVLEKVHAANQQALVQEFIAEADGRDRRLIVVGNRCVAAMERVAAEGDFRANLHRGGSAIPFNPDRKTERLAVTAAKAHGLTVAGVDLLDSRNGALFLEVNSSPGLEGIEQATSIEIASEIIAHLERMARHGKRS